MIASGKLFLAASDYLLYENSMKKDEEIRNHIRDFIIDHVVAFVSDSEPALDAIIDDIVKTGVKNMDASHLAAAIVAGCDYFITTDDRILRYRTDRIRVATPVQFLMENEVGRCTRSQSCA